MMVLFGYDAFGDKFEQVDWVSDNSTDKEIKSLFEEILGIKYDNNCYYKILSKTK